MITFSKMTYSDLSFVNIVRNTCIDYLHDKRMFTLKDTKKWYNSYKPDFYIIRKANKLIGYFRLSNYNTKDKSIYIGADLHIDSRGKGYARLAYERFIPYAFRKFKVHALRLEVLGTNTRAFNLYKSLGFVTVNSYYYCSDKTTGSAVYSIVMQLNRHNWRIYEEQH